MLEDKFKNMKIFQVFVLIVALLSFGYTTLATKTLNEQIDEQKAKIVQLESNLSSDKDHLAQVFLDSNYVKEHSLESDITRDNMFSLDKGEYYVLMYMDGCSHCIDVESKLSGYTTKENKLTMYFYNSSNISEKTDIQWAGKDYDSDKTKVTANDFELVGAPTLLKVKDGTATLFIGADSILAELGL